jgi:cytochrome c-type biogenesis protein CcmH
MKFFFITSPLQKILKAGWLSHMLIVFLIIMPAMLRAADVPFEFNTPEQEQRYQDLAEQLRCLVCQNQSLADSNAELAQDLRNEVYRMIMQGQSDGEIIDFLVARYGDFVLFKPPVKTGTILLWFGPFLLLLAAVLIVIRYTRRSARLPAPELNSADRQRLETLLKHPVDGDNG